MRIKTNEMVPPALDWAVRECSKVNTSLGTFYPSTDWSQGGPIIEREQINLEIHEGGHTRASFYKMRMTFDERAKHYHHQHGPTPLIAAMRCYVASKLGDVVDVPEDKI